MTLRSQKTALIVAVIAGLFACSGQTEEPRQAEPVSLPPAPSVALDAASDAVEFSATETIAIIEARTAQRAPKMKLDAEQASAALGHLRKQLERSTALRRLHSLMPHSTIELCRAIGERGVAPTEGDRIAEYLTHLVAVLEFGNLRQFDINHSHVTGRQWHEIDYSGESMTWQGQKKYWAKRGVGDFKTAEHIHAYMKSASRLPHFARVYKPRGSFDAVQAPPGKIKPSR